jgi:hypothetical protein
MVHRFPDRVTGEEGGVLATLMGRLEVVADDVGLGQARPLDKRGESICYWWEELQMVHMTNMIDSSFAGLTWACPAS